VQTIGRFGLVTVFAKEKDAKTRPNLCAVVASVIFLFESVK